MASFLIRYRIAKIEFLKHTIKTHCMCFNFEEDNDYYRVIFPDGYFPNGVQVSKNIGQANAMEKLLYKMEFVWAESFPNSNEDEANQKASAYMRKILASFYGNIRKL